MQPETFDPFNAKFAADTDPVKADQNAIAILDKLGEADYLATALAASNKDPESLKVWGTKRDALKKSLDSYMGFKKTRGEEPLSFEPEAIARAKFKSEEDFARNAARLYQADDTTFNAILKENGDEEDYKLLEGYMPEGVSQREIYVKERSMKMLGFSDREIESGFAEPQFRKFLKAGEHEPTIDAISRWSLDTINQYDRKHKIAKEASDAAVNSYLGMSDSEKRFEDTLAKANPDLSESERTMIRAIRNNVRGEMEKGAGHIRPIIKKAFNTFAVEEGTTPKFDGEIYGSIDEAVSDLVKLPESDFPTVVAMLAATAEAHGQDVPGFMARVGKNFSRGVKDNVIGNAVGFDIRKTSLRAMDAIKAAEKRGEPPWVNIATIDGQNPSDVARAFIRSHSPSSNTTPATAPGPYSREGMLRQMTPDEIQLAKDTIKDVSKRAEFESHLRNWKQTVAKINGGSPWHPSQWAYTIAGSLPEMVNATNPIGLGVIYAAQVERNMVDFTKRNPSMNPEKIRGAAESGALIYTLAARAELAIIFGKMPAVKNAWAEYGIRLGLETIQEGVQDLSFPVASAAYAALDQSMPDVQLLGADGELMEAIKQAPKNMFAMMPLVALGMGGKRAAAYMDQRALKRLLRNDEMLAQYGLSTDEIAEMKEMTLEEAVDFMEGKNFTFTRDPLPTEVLFLGMNGAPTNAPTALTESGTTMEGGTTENVTTDATEAGTTMPFSVAFDADSEIFTVTDGNGSLTARSPMEAMEAARTLNPEPFVQMPAQLADAHRGRPLTAGEVASLDARAAAALGNPNPTPEQMGNPFAARIEWTLETSNISHRAGQVSHPELTQGAMNILRAMGSRTPIRFSTRRVSRNARGVYWIRQRMIRVRRNDGVTTVFHEIGHAIEDQFLEGGLGDARWMSVRNSSPAMAAELDRLGNALYRGTAPAGFTMSEGFAEYMRMLLEGTHDMSVVAPETDRWFNDNVLTPNPHIAREFEALRILSRQYAEQGSIRRGIASIVRAPGVVQTAREGIATMFSNFEREWIDVLYPLRDIHRVAQQEISYELEPLLRNARPSRAVRARIAELRALQSADPFETATSLALTHDAIVKYMVMEQMRDWNGNPMGANTSLESILEPFQSADDRTELALYLWAKRTIALYQDPRRNTRGRTFDTGLRIEDAIQIFTELDSPLFQVTADRIYSWNNAVLQYAADASPTLAAEIDLIRRIDPGCYIPLMREFQAFEKIYATTTPAAHTGKLTRRFKGSSRRIKDPFSSMVNQARSIVLRAHQRAVTEQLLALRNVNGLGELIFEVPPDRVPDAQRTVVQALDAMSQELDNPDSLAAIRDLAEILESNGDADRLITFWGEAYVPPNALENPIIPIFLDGRRRWFEVNRTAYDALMGMEVFRIPGTLGKVFDLTVGVTNRMFKLGTTGYRASFAMVTNPLRDLSTLYHNTRSTARAPELVMVWGQTILSGFISALSGRMILDSQWNQIYRRLGLEMASRLGQDTRHAESAARRLFQGRVMRAVDPRNVLEYVRDVFQYAESGARITEMKLLARRIGWNPSMPLTREIATRLAVAAKQVTTDFTAAGRQMRWINQILPFSNAQIQGVRSHYDAYNRNPVVFWMKGMMKAALAVSLWLQYKDEEWWYQMPIGERYRYTYIPDPLNDGEIIRIPRSFEVDGFFMGGAQAMLDAWNEQDPKKATEWAKHFITSFVPFGSGPVLLVTPYELGKNEDTFFDRPIVPKDQVANYSHPDWKHLQYGSHTTTLAIELGEMFGKSPRQIDHVIKRFTGGAGMDLVAAFGRGPRGENVERRESTMSDIPVIGTLWSPMGEGSFAPRAIDDLYERMEWANGHERSLKVKGEKESGTDKRMRLILRDATATLSALSEVAKLELKTDERRKIEKMKVQVAKEAVQVFDSKEGTRAKFTKWKKDAELLESRATKAAEDRTE